MNININNTTLVSTTGSDYSSFGGRSRVHPSSPPPKHQHSRQSLEGDGAGANIPDQKPINIQRQNFIRVAVKSLTADRFNNLVDEVLNVMVHSQSQNPGNQNTQAIKHIINTGLLVQSTTTTKLLGTEKQITVGKLLRPFVSSEDPVICDKLVECLIERLRETTTFRAKVLARLAGVGGIGLLMKRAGVPDREHLALQREMLLDVLATLYTLLGKKHKQPSPSGAQQQPKSAQNAFVIPAVKFLSDEQRKGHSNAARPTPPRMAEKDLVFLTDQLWSDDEQCLKYVYASLAAYASFCKYIQIERGYKILGRLLDPKVIEQELTPERHVAYFSMLVAYLDEFTVSAKHYDGRKIFVEIGGLNRLFEVFVKALTPADALQGVVDQQRTTNPQWKVLGLLRVCLALVQSSDQLAAFVMSTVCKLVVHTCCRIVLQVRVKRRPVADPRWAKILEQTDKPKAVAVEAPAANTNMSDNNATGQTTPTKPIPPATAASPAPPAPAPAGDIPQSVRIMKLEPLNLCTELLEQIVHAPVVIQLSDALDRPAFELQYSQLFAPLDTANDLKKVLGNADLKSLEETSKRFEVDWWNTPFEFEASKLKSESISTLAPQSPPQ
eukprot:c12549_g1_i1.p1 GENE.c12549_g1_i1~~c12549_g1_i1.p1  ORF type:complete len:623 (-),score=206.06 c12549_g1_i1:298-2127(-)